MLTSSSNQYLRPEYLTPLPTTLDAKKSPLALLAQTCSQIGADPPNAKPLWPSLATSSSSSSSSSSTSGRDSGTGTACGSSERSTSSTSSSSGTGGSTKKSKGSAPSSHSKMEKAQGKSKHANNGSSSSPKTGSGSPSPTNVTSLVNGSNSDREREKNITIPAEIPLSSSSSSSSIIEDRDREESFRPSSRASGTRSKTPGSIKGSLAEAPLGNVSVMSPGTSEELGSGGGNKSPSLTTTHAPDTPLSNTKSHESSSVNSTLTSSSSTTTSSSQPISASLSSSVASNLKLNLTGPPDLSPLASIAKHHSLSHFPSLYAGLPLPPPSATGIPPYLHSYARLKNASAHLDAACRDPFCGGCQFGSGTSHLLAAVANSHNSHHSGKCPPGCLQCDHSQTHKSSSGSLPSLSPSFFPGFPPIPPSLASLYSAHAAAALASASGTTGSSTNSESTNSTASGQQSGPYVCNWIVGDNYCGARFPSSETLLVHLRSHTSGQVPGISSNSSSSSTALIDPLSSLLEARYGIPPPPPHPLISAAFSRSYPNPAISPLSARYHPYAKPASTALGILGSSLHQPPSASNFSALAAASHPLNPYYPYSLYAQRLGNHP